MIQGVKPYPAYKVSGVSSVGDVPAHWQVAPIGRVGRIFKGNGGSKEDEVPQGVPCVRYGDLYTQHEFFIRKARAFIAPERTGHYTSIRKGDVLFAASGETIEDIGRSAVNLLESDACCGGDVLVFRPNQQMDARFLGYAADSPSSRDQKARMGRGFTVVHIYGAQLRNLALALPSVAEQGAIVRFLDYLDGSIRRYIGAKQRLIRLLEEQKQAITHRAVTRGLDPDVRLKPSGVEWLGDVPAHWEVRTLGQVALSLRTGPFGSVLHQSDYVEGGIPLVNPTHMHGGDILEDRRVSVSPEVAERLSSYRLGKGNLVFSRRGELGRCALVRDREDGWICGTGTIRVELDCANLAPEYLIEALQVPWVGRYLSMSSVGSTMANLNTGILKSLPTLVPPLEEQQALLNYIGAVRRRIARAIGAARREITLIREYRTRLIADVVTGKFDVREMAARLPDEAEESEPLADVDALIGTEDGLSDDLDAAPEVAEA